MGFTVAIVGRPNVGKSTFLDIFLSFSTLENSHFLTEAFELSLNKKIDNDEMAMRVMDFLFFFYYPKYIESIDASNASTKTLSS